MRLPHIKFTINEDGNAVVINADNSLSGEVTIPELIMIDDRAYTVTEIAASAFIKNCENLTSVRIPSTVTKIGNNAFDVTKVTRYYEWRKIK